MGFFLAAVFIRLLMLKYNCKISLLIIKNNMNHVQFNTCTVPSLYIEI